MSYMLLGLVMGQYEIDNYTGVFYFRTSKKCDINLPMKGEAEVVV